MSIDIIIGAIIAVIAIILLVLRTNSGVVFFGVCAGSVLASQIYDEASIISSMIIKDGDLNKSIVSIALILLPAVFCAIFLRGSVGASKFLFNFIPSFAVGGLLVLLITPLLGQNESSQVLTSNIWGVLQRYQPLILASGTLSSMALIWLTQRTNKKHKNKKLLKK